MRIQRITDWYLKYERILSSISLVGGFVFDAVTLKRVDMFLENVWVILHLLVAAIGIILINWVENKRPHWQQKTIERVHFWLIIIVQFAFGGLLSTFLVFYFRSGAWGVSWPFLVLLGIFFVFNELLKHHYTRLVFQTIVLYLSIYSFAIFIVPVVIHHIGGWVFALSGLLSLATIWLFIKCLRWISMERFGQSKRALWFSIIVLTLIINVLYFTRLIPPIPLSLKDAGIYYGLTRQADGNYLATEEVRGVLSYLRLTLPAHQIAGANTAIYAYSSVFSPSGLDTTVIHNWQRYDTDKNSWVSSAKISLPIVGGRDGGYRTYSNRSDLSPGLWRVDVETPSGQLIGRIKFNLENVSVMPELTTTVLE